MAKQLPRVAYVWRDYRCPKCSAIKRICMQPGEEKRANRICHSKECNHSIEYFVPVTELDDIIDLVQDAEMEEAIVE